MVKSKTYIYLFLLLIWCGQVFGQNHWQKLSPELSSIYLMPRVLYSNPTVNKLFVGGFLGSPLTSDSVFAVWQGNGWQGVGGDTNRLNFDQIILFAMTGSQNKIYIGGVGRIYGIHQILSMPFIIVWDAQEEDWVFWPWPASKHPFDLGEEGAVWSIQIIDSNIYVGGIFNQINDQPCKSFAVWNGTDWECMGLDFGVSSTFVNAIAKYNNTIFIGGNFHSDITPVNKDTLMDIAQWTGTGWKSVGGGIKGSTSIIDAMVIYKGELYVAGYFFKSAGNAGNHIMKWDGEQWSGVGGGIWGGQVHSMKVHDGKLYVVGAFDIAGGVPAKYIAVWDGEDWCGLGSQFDNTIGDLAFYNDTLIVAGGFWTIDGDSIYKVAKWLGGNYVAVCGNTTAVEEQETQKAKVFPNPAAQWVHIQLPAEAVSANTTYKIINMQGQTVLRGTVNQMPAKVNVGNLASGLYTCLLTNPTGSYAARFVKR